MRFGLPSFSDPEESTIWQNSLIPSEKKQELYISGEKTYATPQDLSTLLRWS